jgi:hypothetical protein
MPSFPGKPTALNLITQHLEGGLHGVAGDSQMLVLFIAIHFFPQALMCEHAALDVGMPPPSLQGP